MAINPYGGNYSTTIGGFPNAVTVPYIQPQQQPNVVNMVLVNSEDEARNYYISPGNSMFFMDSKNSIFYTKSVDFSGIPTFKKYQFQEITAGEQKNATDEYVTREEFEEWKKSMNRKPPYQKKERDQV